MITIEQLNVTVTLAEGAEPGEAAFTRLFNRSIDRWWREVQSRIKQDARSASDRTLVGRSPEAM